MNTEIILRSAAWSTSLLSSKWRGAELGQHPPGLLGSIASADCLVDTCGPTAELLCPHRDTTSAPAQHSSQEKPPRKRSKSRPAGVLLSGRMARRTACRRCGARVYRGFDDDRMAIEVSVEIRSIDHLHEVVAILSGRSTYDFVNGRLYYREPWHRKTPSKYPVHVNHECAGAN